MDYYNQTIGNELEAKRLAMTYMELYNDKQYNDKLGKKQKLYKIRRL